MSQTTKGAKLHIFLLFSLAGLFIWSFIGCFDFLTWLLDALPVVIGIAVLISVYRKFQFTRFAYILIWLYAIFLLIGAHYTYSRVPVFNWIREAFELSRNYYDRLGHLLQGFVPAIIAREVLLRKSPVPRGGWLLSIVLCFCLAVSALYELFEWFVFVIAQDDSVIFLAMQGDAWDAQKDMALCLVGASFSLLTVAKVHDKALNKIKN
jgi:putative membrane protein